MTVKSQPKRFPYLLLRNVQYSGMLSTLLYNWPIFAGGILFGVVALIVGMLLPAPWSWAVIITGSGTLFLLFAILLAVFVVYDAGKHHEYDRLAELGDVANANVVLDITCGKLRGSRGLLTHFKSGHYFLIDIYDGKKMNDLALRRARDLEPPLEVGHRIYRRPGHASNLPVPHQWADVIYCSFSLHELQDPADRDAIFDEFARVLKPGGRLLIAEHGRNWLNFLAFGPGVLSFFTPATWRRHIAKAGLTIQHQERWRGLVHLWVVGREAR